MYYTTKRNTDLGKKFTAIENKKMAISDLVKKMGDAYGFKSFIGKGDANVAFGGLAAAQFNGVPNLDLWDELEEMPTWYVPNSATVTGRVLAAEMSSIPIITYDEINLCLGAQMPSRYVGLFLQMGNNKLFGFHLGKEITNHIELPAKVKEVTRERFDLLFNTKVKENELGRENGGPQPLRPILGAHTESR